MKTMIRADYFNSIEEDLSLLVTRLELRGRLNILDLHVHSEDFYLNFFNLLFLLKLVNANTTKQNAAGIDLVDVTNSVVIQVSATATKQKIDSALSKDLSKYKGYAFYFISICKDAAPLRAKNYLNPHGLKFSPADDIYDVLSLLEKIRIKSLADQKVICEFLRREIKRQPAPLKTETNLARIIDVLSKENWSPGEGKLEKIPFDIEAKIAFNHLLHSKVLIDEHKIHYARLAKIYSEFDKMGANKSLSVLNGIQTEYVSLVGSDTPDKVFLMIIQKLKERICSSANYTLLDDEELVMCTQILVVDAFIKCKIFKNPIEGHSANS